MSVEDDSGQSGSTSGGPTSGGPPSGGPPSGGSDPTAPLPTWSGATSAPPPWSAPDPWTSELWGRPETVGGYARASAAPAVVPAPPPPPPPGRAPRRGLLAVAALVLIALLAGGAALAGTLTRSPSDPTAAPPKPTATGTPSVPTPSSSPSVPSSPQSIAPTAPPTTLPQSPPNGSAPYGSAPNGGQQPGTQQQRGTLSPQQAAAAAAVSKGLVDINTNIGYEGARGAGTGIVLSADGLVLTNHHVVTGATAIRVTDVGNSKTYDATVLGYDASHDVAVLRLKGASGLTVAPLGTSSTVHVGDAVVAVGNAGGVGGTPSAVAGTVQALDQPITVRDETNGSTQRLTGLIQFDAPIQPGDSGGALVDAGGKVVGVVTAESVGRSSRDVTTATDGYAIPLDLAKSIAQQIIDGKSSATVHIGETGFLGVQVVPDGQPGASRTGAQVGAVVPGSAAEKAGLQAGDVITSVGGRTVTSATELHDAVSPHRPGDTVSVVWTDTTGQRHTASIRLGTGPVG